MSVNKINTIRFDRVKKSFSEWMGPGDNDFEEIPFITTDVYIDNQNLIEHLKKYELPFAKKIGHPEIAGLYIGSDPSDSLKKAEEFNNFSPDSLIYLFQCEECMSALCPYDLTFNIRKENQYIYWFNFQQTKSNYVYNPVLDSKFRESSHNKLMNLKADWDYSRFGPFIFSEKNYNQAVKELERTILEEK